MKSMSKLLEGLKVVDLTHVLAGPYSSYQLGLLGAEVIRIENPVASDLPRIIDGKIFIKLMIKKM